MSASSSSSPSKKRKTAAADAAAAEHKYADVLNFVGGEAVPASADTAFLDVTCPRDRSRITRVVNSTAQDVAAAVANAKAAFAGWSALTSKARVQVLMRFQRLMVQHEDELAELIMREHGKNRAEALGDVRKGNETVEWACSLPQVGQGNFLEVSRGVTCRDIRRPLGVVASIVPFNFPAMVPLWTLPIAIAAGNAMIVKPSEKVPLTFSRIAQLLVEAGVPAGVVNVVHGTREAVEAIIDHPDVKAVSFVGSTKVASMVAARAQALNKRVLALGGAKNHLVTMPDCNLELAAQDIVNSATGCTGQRCMAASVLLTVGKQQKLIDRVVEIAKSLGPGKGPRELGPVIDQASLDKIHRYIDASAKAGAKVLVDGRSWAKQYPEGFWCGPTVILHHSKDDAAMKEEIFGPVLSVYQCENKEEAIAIENSSPYGNAAAVYTSTGENADWFTSRFGALMLGVNIGVPVPREPFSFGGTKGSKFGNSDITGDGGLEFWTERVKITGKWVAPPPEFRTWMD